MIYYLLITYYLLLYFLLLVARWWARSYWLMGLVGELIIRGEKKERERESGRTR